MSEIVIDQIDYSRFMVREIDGQTVNDLKANIRKYGVLQPILVFLNEKKRYEVICGNHRLCAAKGVGLKTIPCIVKQISRSDDALLLSLTENIQRLEMNPIREGQIYETILQNKYSVDRLSELLGKSKLYIQGRINIFKNLHEDLKCHIGKTLTLTNAIAISRLPKQEQLNVFNQISELANTKPSNPSLNPYGYGGYGQSPYCTCEKCGAKHLKGVSVKVE